MGLVVRPKVVVMQGIRVEAPIEPTPGELSSKNLTRQADDQLRRLNMTTPMAWDLASSRPGMKMSESHCGLRMSRRTPRRDQLSDLWLLILMISPRGRVVSLSCMLLSPQSRCIMCMVVL